MKEFKNFSKIAKIQIIIIFIIFILILSVIYFGNFSPEFNGVVIYSSFLVIILASTYIFEENEKNKRN